MKKLLYLIPLLLSLLAPPAFAAAINHPFTEVNSIQTTTSASYVDVTGAAITSGNFTAGKKYLLYITVQVWDNANGLWWMQTLHGTTAFAESEANLLSTGTNTYAYTYTFMTVWTAVASEGIKLQYKVTGTTPTLTVDFVSMLALNLSDDVVENTDWFTATRTTDDALSTTPTDGASVTFTPSGASDWLVLTYAQHDSTGTTTTDTSRIVRSGEASSSFPAGIELLDHASIIFPFSSARVFGLTAASNTFKEQSEASATANTRLHSNIFALNLNKFAVHANAYTEADVVLTGTNYGTTIQTLSITPTLTGDVWIGSHWIGDIQNAGRRFRYRIQVDAADQPAGQTTADIQFHTAGAVGGAGDEVPYSLSTLTSLSNAAHTINLDASANSITDSPAASERTLWAVTMELAAAGGSEAGSRRRNQ